MQIKGISYKVGLYLIVFLFLTDIITDCARNYVRRDEEKNKTIYINTKSIYGQTRLDTVATRVKPGYHTITVRTVRKGKFS